MAKGNNTVILRGTITEEPKVHHDTQDDTFYLTTIACERLRGVKDFIPVMVEEKTAEQLKTGARYEIFGKFHQRNEDGHCKFAVCPESIVEYEGHELDENRFMFEGYISKAPVLRKTPLKKRVICDTWAAIQREKEGFDYIPCISWYELAEEMNTYRCGILMSATGRIQIREYQKLLEDGKTETRTAIEVSIYGAHVVRDNRRSGK